MALAEKTDKRVQLLIAAEQLFAEKGFDGTSVRDIAQLAEVNLAMISYYFGSKERLLKALIEYNFNLNIELLEDLSKNESISPMDKILQLADFYVDKFILKRRFHTIVSQEYNTGRSSEIKELITNFKMRNFERVKGILAEGQRKKVFRKVDPEMTMATLIGTINQVINSRNMYCILLRIDSDNEEDYRRKVTERLKIHFRQLLRSHLAAE